MSETIQNFTHFDYRGAHVLVTGGTSGIGAGIAAAYREAGAQVTITGTRASTADYDTDLSGYRYLQLDVENMAQIDAVAQAQPELDILVNNAGIALPSIGLDEWDPDVFARAINIHLVSGFRMARRCLRCTDEEPPDRGRLDHRHRLDELVLRHRHRAGLRCGEDRSARHHPRAGGRVGAARDPRQSRWRSDCARAA